ncbi:MAG: hypothetical protein ABIJ08_04070, partial [Nanoarchaeota archaeon]
MEVNKMKLGQITAIIGLGGILFKNMLGLPTSTVINADSIDKIIDPTPTIETVDAPAFDDILKQRIEDICNINGTNIGNIIENIPNERYSGNKEDNHGEEIKRLNNGQARTIQSIVEESYVQVKLDLDTYRIKGFVAEYTNFVLGSIWDIVRNLFTDKKEAEKTKDDVNKDLRKFRRSEEIRQIRDVQDISIEKALELAEKYKSTDIDWKINETQAEVRGKVYHTTTYYDSDDSPILYIVKDNKGNLANIRLHNKEDNKETGVIEWRYYHRNDFSKYQKDRVEWKVQTMRRENEKGSELGCRREIGHHADGRTEYEQFIGKLSLGENIAYSIKKTDGVTTLLKTYDIGDGLHPHTELIVGSLDLNDTSMIIMPEIETYGSRQLPDGTIVECIPEDIALHKITSIYKKDHFTVGNGEPRRLESTRIGAEYITDIIEYSDGGTC